MRPSRRFDVLSTAATSRLDAYRERAVAAAMVRSGASRNELASVTIELLNLWANFCRSYYLSCILRPRRVRGGKVVATGFGGTTFADAIAVVMSRHKPYVRPSPNGTFKRRDEPPWFDVQVLTTSCQAIGCSNLTHIQAAVSTGTRAFLDLPVFRNFFAHRNEDSAAKARMAAATRYSIPAIRRHPADIVAARPYGRPVPLLVDWIDDIRVTVELLCE
jgi:hypothetical protein